jgi:hypothetical protein
MALADATIITNCRYLLHDAISGAYRWTDAELTVWIKDGAREIARLRPEAVTGYQSTPTAVVVPTDSTTIQEMYATALMNYVCWRALAKDGEEGEAGQANGYMQMFYQSMGIGKP